MVRRGRASARNGAIVLAAAIGLSGAASAQTTNWQNGTGDWFNAGNWSAGVPNSATLNTNVTNGGTAQIIAGTADAGSATPGATLTIGGVAGSMVDLQAGGGLNFERMVIQTGGTFRAANDNWGGGCSNPCITLGGGTLLRVGGAGVYWDGFTLLANTTSTVMAGAGSSLALEPGRSGQHLGIASLYTPTAAAPMSRRGETPASSCLPAERCRPTTRR
jgi:hypothetical protein